MAITNSPQKAKIVLFVIIGIIIVALVVICATGERYNEDRIIGKTRDEIEAIYGSFDITLGSLAVYEVSEDFSDAVWRRFMGGSTYNYLYIIFDENGYAKEIDKGCRPGR